MTDLRTPTPAEFTLHPRLAADTRFIIDLPLCRLLLLNDRRFPWLVLVPRRDDVREIHELSADDRTRLVEEIAFVSAAWQRQHGAGKMNVAALGNQVPQLHVHVIARFEKDVAWPSPVWSVPGAVAYTPDEWQQSLAEARQALMPDAALAAKSQVTG